MTEYNLQQSELKKVFPKHSYKNLCTVIAKDNIDLNASSTTAKNHYHGACLPMLGFPSKEVQSKLYTSNLEMKKECRYDQIYS